MGTSADFAELGKKFYRLPGEIDRGMLVATRGAAITATRSIRGEISRDTHGTMRLSGVGKSGARVNARFGKISTRDPHNPTAYIRAVGPMHFLESDTREHDIPKTGKRLRRKRKALKFQHGGQTVFAKTVHHPGTRGKKPWHRGAKKASEPAAAVYQREMTKAMGRVFG